MNNIVQSPFAIADWSLKMIKTSNHIQMHVNNIEALVSDLYILYINPVEKESHMMHYAR